MKAGQTPAANAAWEELLRVASAVAEGDLDRRCDAASHTGPPAAALAQINAMLDTLAAPLGAAVSTVERLAAGNIPEFVTADYPGQFHSVKKNINICVAMMYGVHREIQDLVEFIKTGRLTARGNDWDFQGCWRDLIAGLNELIDSFMNPFQVTANYVSLISEGRIPEKILQRYPGEFNCIRRNLNVLVDTVNGLTGDITRLCEAAVEGNLDQRAEAAQYGHEFGRLVQGINATLDAVIGPLNESARVVGEVSRGNLTVRLEGAYRGEFARLQGDINRMTGNLRAGMTRIRDGAAQLAAAAQSLKGISATLARSADNTATQAQTASRRGEQVADNVRAVAVGAGQTQASMGEIAAQINDVFRSAEQAAADADAACQTVSQLAAAGADIGEVVEMITTIAGRTNSLAAGARGQSQLADGAARGFGVVADEVKRMAGQISGASATLNDKMSELKGQLGAHRQDRLLREIDDVIGQVSKVSWQTSLLAINAAIEGARASESGRHFGEVVSEIGGLAGHTTQAAGNAGHKLVSIRSGSSQAIEAIQGIAAAVKRLREISESIAGETRQRAATTAEMAQRASDAADGTEAIAHTVSAVAGAAATTTAGARETDRHATELETLATQMRDLVSAFQV